jgi:hypothetical protein
MQSRCYRLLVQKIRPIFVVMGGFCKVWIQLLKFTIGKMQIRNKSINYLYSEIYIPT